MKQFIKTVTCLTVALVMTFTMSCAPEVNAANSTSKSTSANSSKNVIKTSKKAVKKNEAVYNWKISLDHSIKGSRIKKMKK